VGAGGMVVGGCSLRQGLGVGVDLGGEEGGSRGVQRGVGYAVDAVWAVP
jgi:hypothetical protein